MRGRKDKLCLRALRRLSRKNRSVVHPVTRDKVAAGAGPIPLRQQALARLANVRREHQNFLALNSLPLAASI